MMKKKRVACFFTAGYTEVNALKCFFRNINDQIEYIQLCPTGRRKSKTSIKRRHIDAITDIQNGLTGNALIDYVVSIIKNDFFQDEEYDAILIEDDKDDRFLKKDNGGFGSGSVVSDGF